MRGAARRQAVAGLRREVARAGHGGANLKQA